MSDAALAYYEGGPELSVVVLDVGAGIGGPARTLATHLGARVTALDPTRRFSDLKQELCRRSGLDGQVQVVNGDARQMPVADGGLRLGLDSGRLAERR